MNKQLQTIEPKAQTLALAECLTSISSLYGRTYEERTVRVWLDALRDFQPDEITSAFRSYLRHHKELPSIAGVIEEINLLRYGGCHGAFRLAVKAARAFRSRGYPEFVIFETSAVHFAIETLGGWNALLLRVEDASAFSFFERDFIQAFKAYRSGIEYLAGFGPFYGGNVKLVGDPGRACEVYRNGQKEKEHSSGWPESAELRINGHITLTLAPFPDELSTENMELGRGPSLVDAWGYEPLAPFLCKAARKEALPMLDHAPSFTPPQLPVPANAKPTHLL